MTYGIINRLALWADQKLKDEDETVGWMCVAKRPETEPSKQPSRQ
jgi:hypothetical protein